MTMAIKTPDPKLFKVLAWGSDDFEIPPFPRAPEDGTREATESMIRGIDAKIAKLAKLGLRPHPTMLGYRQELVGQLDSNGPYQLRFKSGIF